MENKNILKLILFREGKEVKVISEPNTDESLKYILDSAEKWKKKDIKRHTVRFSIGK